MSFNLTQKPIINIFYEKKFSTLLFGDEMTRSKHNKIINISVLFLTVFGFLTGCTHMVTIKSDPPGAKVTDLTFGELGQTPLSHTVEHGSSLHLTFSKPGFKPVKKDSLHIKQDRTVMATLNTYPTLLFIESIPAGASLQVFDCESGAKVQLMNPTKITSKVHYTNRSHEIPATLSEANIVLERKGYKPLRKRIKLEPNIENRFQFQMEQLRAKLRIVSNPTGAEVYERKKGFLGRTPLDLDFTWEQLASFSQLHDAFDLDSVDLHLTIKKQGYLPREVMKKLYIYQDNPVLTILLDLL
jgi:hypothetical protein